MKIGDVLKKERTRKKLTGNDVARRLRIPVEQYLEIEAGDSLAEQWAPKLAAIAIKLQTPVSRLIAETGKSAEAAQSQGQCGRLIKAHRLKRSLSSQELAEEIDLPISELEAVENGASPLETYGPFFLAFAELIEQPVFNLFYPCGLPYTELNEYP